MLRKIFFIGTTLWLLAISAWTQGLLVTGVVKDQETRKALANVNITVEGSNIGTVTNADGGFSLSVSKEQLLHAVTVSHLGYQNVFLPSETLLADKELPTIWLKPTAFTLDMLNVYGGDPLDLVTEAIRKISRNYAGNDHQFSAFYRETIQKRKRYIGISEAVMDVYKTGYKERNVTHDRVQVQKGRRLESQKRSDTLAVKIAGGPNMPVHLDVVKNPEEFLTEEMLPCYRFSMHLSMIIDDRMQYGFRTSCGAGFSTLSGAFVYRPADFGRKPCGIPVGLVQPRKGRSPYPSEETVRTPFQASGGFLSGDISLSEREMLSELLAEYPSFQVRLE